MAQQPRPLVPIYSLPGVQRDGTDLAAQAHTDAQWVRWQRGLPRKMGGYRSVTQYATSPFRSILIDSRNGVYTAHVMSPWGIQRIQFDQGGAGGAIYDRTPAGYVHNELNTFTSDLLWSSFGSPFAAMIVASTPDILDIANDTAGGVYYGDITGTTALTPILDSVANGSGAITTSGGCVVMAPFLVLYGSNGLIRISNADNVSGDAGWAVGGSNLALSNNIGGSKIVKGLPMRGGTSSPASLYWALDALYRVTFVGGTSLWRFDTLSASTSILSKAGVIEYDGIYYWVGVDRFLQYSGVVQELPNDKNLNWFFENVNMAQRQKVWAMKMPRFGEIWWFFPSGTNTECDSVVIYNVREKNWYDNRCARSAGMQAEIFPYPVMAGTEDQVATTALTFTAVSGVMQVGDTVTGGTSGATGTIYRIVGTTMNLINTSIISFTAAETITNQLAKTATVGTVLGTQYVAPVWQHEFGKDKIIGQNVDAIPAWFKTSNLDFSSGGPAQATSQQQGMDVQTRILQLEPDFVQVGDMTVQAVGAKYANSPKVYGPPYSFSSTTEKVDMKEQFRQLALIFSSNVLGGDFQAGKTLGVFLPGDTHG